MRFATILFLLLPVSNLTTAQELVGKVYDNKTSEFLYSETHVFGDDNLHTLYTNANQVVIGERLVEFDDGRVRSYQLKQASLEFFESVERQADAINVKAKSGQKLKEARIERDDSSNVVIDAGFSNFIARNWNDLVAGKKVTFDFVSAARLSVVKLQLKKVNSKKSSLSKHGSTDGVIMFNMNIANPLLRMLLKPIEVGYYQDTKQLAYYQGISNLKDANGKQFDGVHIKFDRQPSAPYQSLIGSAE